MRLPLAAWPMRCWLLLSGWALAIADVTAIDANSITLRASNGWAKNLPDICRSFRHSDMALLNPESALFAIIFA